MALRFAVMGNPIAHSLSPFIHQRFAEQLGIELSYEAIQVTDENRFASTVADFFGRGGKGLNITLPYKEKAFALAARNSFASTKAKAANTLWMDEGKLHADNTDGAGLLKDLANYCELKTKQVLLLGAGGAARGVIGPLLAAGISQLVVVNRSPEKAFHLQLDFPQIQCSPINDLKINFDLIINATSASLNSENLRLSASLLKPETLCYDLAYAKNGSTPFVNWAHSQGIVGVDGLGMLVEQAAESFYIWHGLRPDVRAVLAELKEGQND